VSGTTTTIHIRDMQPDEKKRLGAIMRRAFSPMQALFFSWKGHTLVAERDGELLGGTVLETFSLPAERKGGIVLWIFTDPAVHGQGVGQALTEAAIAYFDAQECTDMFACVEGYNPSSSKLFATRDFSILSPGAQLRRYGLGFLPMWFHTFHFIDIGHFLWGRPPADRPDSPALQWWGTLAVNTGLFWLALWRQHGFQRFNPLQLLIVPLCLLVFFGARSLSMLGAARAQGLSLRYRAWESGYPLALVIALLMGGIYPNPGSYYPRTDRWRYREWVPKLGPVALAGIVPTLLISWGLWAVDRWGSLSYAWKPWHSVAVMIGVMLSILDVLTIFFPLVSYNGRRVWDWKPWLWGVLALVTGALIVL
jgi:GNAT superfamily N-acetyltransferase